MLSAFQISGMVKYRTKKMKFPSCKRILIYLTKNAEHFSDFWYVKIEQKKMKFPSCKRI